MHCHRKHYEIAGHIELIGCSWRTAAETWRPPGGLTSWREESCSRTLKSFMSFLYIERPFSLA